MFGIGHQKTTKCYLVKTNAQIQCKTQITTQHKKEKTKKCVRGETKTKQQRPNIFEHTNTPKGFWDDKQKQNKQACPQCFVKQQNAQMRLR